LARVIAPVISLEESIATYVNMVRDSEPEVRSVAAAQLNQFVTLLDGDSILKHLMVPLRDLVLDASQFVRASVAHQINGMALILGKEATIEHLLPLLLLLLRDEYSDVRLNVISKLEQVNNVIGIDLLSQSLLPAIVDLAGDKQWRVRLAVIEHIPMLSKQLGVEFFNERLADLCLSWLVDPVFSIRNAASHNLRRLAGIFGVEWTQQIILPKVLSIASHPNYLYRITVLWTLCELAETITYRNVFDYVLPIACRLSQDNIPNVRFNAAKAFEKLKSVFKSDSSVDSTAYTILRECLSVLSQDSDSDVQFYANRASSNSPKVLSVNREFWTPSRAPSDGSIAASY
jgi:serine/threonine-protein phosphatase 2A regulatory subunit A